MGEDRRQANGTKALAHKIGSDASSYVQEVIPLCGLPDHSSLGTEAAEPNQLTFICDREIAVASFRLDQKLMPVVWFTVIH